MCLTRNTPGEEEKEESEEREGGEQGERREEGEGREEREEREEKGGEEREERGRRERGEREERERRERREKGPLFKKKRRARVKNKSVSTWRAGGVYPWPTEGLPPRCWKLSWVQTHSTWDNTLPSWSQLISRAISARTAGILLIRLTLALQQVTPRRRAVWRTNKVSYTLCRIHEREIVLIAKRAMFETKEKKIFFFSFF